HGDVAQDSGPEDLLVLQRLDERLAGGYLCLQRGELLQAVDLRLDARVHGLLRGELVLGRLQPRRLQDVDESEERQQPEGRGHHRRRRRTALLLLANDDWKKVDLSHPRTPGSARRTATASSGSASAAASGGRSRRGVTLWNGWPCATTTGSRSASTRRSSSSFDPPPVSMTRPILAPGI